MTYVSPPGSDPNQQSEIEEESKEQSANGSQNNEELFKHLSYLSQLNNDVQKH